jgi:anti-sigma regulatory factor (Ser/Thr protein kinase)
MSLQVASQKQFVGAVEELVSRKLQYDVRLLVSELVTNSVRHAGQPAGAPVRISAASVDGVVRIEVHDQGQGRVRRRAPDRRAGGLGLHLVERLAARRSLGRQPRERHLRLVRARAARAWQLDTELGSLPARAGSGVIAATQSGAENGRRERGGGRVQESMNGTCSVMPVSSNTR